MRDQSPPAPQRQGLGEAVRTVPVDSPQHPESDYVQRLPGHQPREPHVQRHLEEFVVGVGDESTGMGLE